VSVGYVWTSVCFFKSIYGDDFSKVNKN
jgi:hypothetical protein